jgi:hypothetical protein
VDRDCPAICTVTVGGSGHGEFGDDDSDPVLAGRANNLLKPVDPKAPTQDVNNVGRRSARTRLREPITTQSPINVRFLNSPDFLRPGYVLCSCSVS